MTTIEDWKRAGTYFEFRGHRVFYRSEGKGLPLLCIHGYPTASYDFYKVWPTLTERFRVIAPDMLGFGYTDKPRGHRYSIFEQAELHVALLEHLGIGAVDVLCHDYGVTVGQELLARHAEGKAPHLRSIAFLNGGLFPETHRARPVQRLLASPLGPLLSRLSGEAQFRKTMCGVFGPRTQPSHEELAAFYALMARDDGKRALAGLIAYMEERRAQRPRWVGAFVETRVPMLVINGVLDPVSGAHMVDRLLELRPGTEVVRLEVGHYPQVEAPKEVLAAWLPFVAARQAPDLPPR
jgi:pimeloyl-ACP methyl ester carboxylesterase